MNGRGLDIRPATAADVGLIVSFVRELAEYERLLHEVEMTEADARRDLFGENPRCFCDIAEHGGKPVGFALWFTTYSTWLGRHGLWLEDLFVLPEHRGAGHGKALLAALARICVDNGWGRLEWNVLDWNEPALAFYRAIGARPLDEWTVQRLSGEALAALARS